MDEFESSSYSGSTIQPDLGVCWKTGTLNALEKEREK